MSVIDDPMTASLATSELVSTLDPGRWGVSRFARKQAKGRMILVPKAHSLRAQTEACIREVYEDAFGARGFEFPAMLVALLGADEQPLCAAGFRTAGEGFLSEAYLDVPIERAFSARLNKPVRRASGFEVTTLASRKVEVSAFFLRRLALFGKAVGFEWSFFTATTRLRRLLRHLGMPILELVAADPQRLSNPERWGSYFTHAPRVCAVDGRWLDGAETREERIATHA